MLWPLSFWGMRVCGCLCLVSNLLCNVVEILRAELLEYKEIHLVLVRLLICHWSTASACLWDPPSLLCDGTGGTAAEVCRVYCCSYLMCICCNVRALLFFLLYFTLLYFRCWTATSTQVFLGFPVPVSKCSDGSQHSKLPLHASHVALRT